MRARGGGIGIELRHLRYFIAVAVATRRPSNRVMRRRVFVSGVLALLAAPLAAEAQQAPRCGQSPTCSTSVRRDDGVLAQ